MSYQAMSERVRGVQEAIVVLAKGDAPSKLQRDNLRKCYEQCENLLQDQSSAPPGVAVVVASARDHFNVLLNCATYAHVCSFHPSDTTDETIQGLRQAIPSRLARTLADPSFAYAMTAFDRMEGLSQ